MAQVLLAFSGIIIMIMEAELGVGQFPRADLEAMIHCVRLCGYYYLGKKILLSLIEFDTSHMMACCLE